MACKESAPSLLLALPDPCLLAVMHCCAADQRSLFSAARAHSRLHQAAVQALHSITVTVNTDQKAEDVLLYLDQHGQHVDYLRIRFRGGGRQPTIFELPQPLQLSSLDLECCWLLLRPGHGSPGLLGSEAVAALKQLRMKDCKLFDLEPGEALSHLPASLEHLSIDSLTAHYGKRRARRLVHQASSSDSGSSDSFEIFCPTDLEVISDTFELARLQQLTYLQLCGLDLAGGYGVRLDLQPLEALTRLADLRLASAADIVTVGVLSGMSHLTRLEWRNCKLDPGVLAGKTQLQHLDTCNWRMSTAGVAQILSSMQQLQELTYLSLADSLGLGQGNPPAAAYAALTASSKLRDLFIDTDGTDCTVPEGVWQHMFPASRQLPHLQSVSVSCAMLPYGDLATAQGCSRLVSCCPGLASLSVRGSVMSAAILAPLQVLSGLHTLRFNWHDGESIGVVCQLTGLRELRVGSLPAADATSLGNRAEGLLLQLTQLQQLTSLAFEARFSNHAPQNINLTCRATGDEPVWRQLLRLYVDHADLALAQQAAAALAE